MLRRYEGIRDCDKYDSFHGENFLIAGHAERNSMNQDDGQKSECTNDEAMINLIYPNWETIAAVAYDCYLHSGRGVITMSEMEGLSGMPDVEFLPESDRETFEAGGWLNNEVTHQMREYDPQNEVIILVLRLSGEVFCLRFRTPSSRLSPRSACEEIYRSDFARQALESPMNDSLQSEQDQRREIEEKAAVKLIIKETLRACCDNLEAFHATGLGWEKLSPQVNTTGSFDSRLILLAALRDGVFRIADSDGKILVKPGPRWVGLEAILLCQDETDGTPS